MDHPKAIGDRSAMVAMLALNDAGYAVSIPFGENVRYDLIIDDGTRLARVHARPVGCVSAPYVSMCAAVTGITLGRASPAVTIAAMSITSSCFVPTRTGSTSSQSRNYRCRRKPPYGSILHSMDNDFVSDLRMTTKSRRSLQQNLTRLLVREDLPLHAL
jgi:PD-(D/E)XK endonuclease